MSYDDPTNGSGSGILATFSFKNVTDDDGNPDGTDVGFEGDLDYPYVIESGSFNESSMRGNVWVWVTGSNYIFGCCFIVIDQINGLKSHASWITGPLVYRMTGSGSV